LGDRSSVRGKNSKDELILALLLTLCHVFGRLLERGVTLPVLSGFVTVNCKVLRREGRKGGTVE
jgi:hypothetical protein